MKTKETLQNLKKKEISATDYIKGRGKSFVPILIHKISSIIKTFGPISILFFSDKGNSRKEITLVDGEEVFWSEIKVADTLNTFFENAEILLGIPQIDHLFTDVSNINDPIEKIIKKIQNILTSLE